MTSIENTEPVQRVANGVRGFNTVIASIVADGCLTAARNGDASLAINPKTFADSWESAGQFRDQMLLSLARSIRDEWRRDVAEIVGSQPAEKAAARISEALDLRLRCVLDFAFKFLTPRHVCFLGDCLVLAFEAEMKSTEFTKELAQSAAKSQLQTQPLLNALVLGASGMVRYQPERVILVGR